MQLVYKPIVSYNKIIRNAKYPRLTKERCHKCSSYLILFDVAVEKVEGQYGDITTSTYHCSNIECQKETDAEISRMMKKKKEKDLLNKKRLENIKKSRKKAKDEKRKRS